MLPVLVHGDLGGPPVELGRGLPKQASQSRVALPAHT
jgi:hypothetical protein